MLYISMSLWFGYVINRGQLELSTPIMDAKLTRSFFNLRVGLMRLVRRVNIGSTRRWFIRCRLFGRRSVL